MVSKTVRRIAALVVPVILAACSNAPEPVRTPAFYDRLDLHGGKVDPASSLSMVNLYRSNNAARPLVWDEALARIAQGQADRMASADKVHSTDDARLEPELAAAGVRYRTYLVNLSAGYRTFAEAFSGWRELKTHNANMLDPRVSRVGLATAFAPGSKYKIFWAMVLVEPM